jgi:pimeloyl-ACP methyl ester carboxylesterase
MHSVTSKDGTKIAYDTTGQGPVIILVLGALNSRKTGAKLAKALAPDFTAVSYDRRGRGNSTDTPPYDPVREIEDLAAVIEEVGAPVYLYGHSSGAALALQATTMLSEKIKKLAIYEAPYTLTESEAQIAKEYDRKLKQALAAGDTGEAVTLFVRHVGVTDKQIEAMKRLPLWKGLTALAPTLAYDSDVLGAGHALPTPLLSRIAIPTLVMHGGKGAPSMRDAAEAICEAIPDARLLTVEGQDHGVSPTALAPLLLDFFR